MPTAALRPCRVCGDLGCHAHVRTPWQHTKPVHRITGRKLQRLRMELWAREPHCRACGRLLMPSQMIRDHIVPLEERGTDTVENCQPLCHECSDVKTKEESRRGVQRGR